MKLSLKKKDQLYDAVHNEIMTARIAIARLTNNDAKLGEAVDKVLFRLTIDAPSKAVKVFTETESKTGTDLSLQL